MSELRIVHPVLTNQAMVVRDREVWLDETGTTSPLTPEEHEYLTSIPGFVCASEYDYTNNRPRPQSVQLSDAELGRIKAAGFRLVPIGDPDPVLMGEPLVRAVVDTFDGEIVHAPTEADIAEKCDDDEEDEPFEDLFDAWLGMDEDERCSTVSDLEENGADETLLVALFDYEANLLNGPRVIAALDTAIGHLRPPTSVGQIAQNLVRNSAAGKTSTKNPAHAKKKGK